MLLQKIIYYKRDCYELSIGADMDDFASIRSALQEMDYRNMKR